MFPHDPESCTRHPCRRCDHPPTTPTPPPPVDHQTRGPVAPARIWPVNPDMTTSLLTDALRVWRPLGATTVERFTAWHQPRLPDSQERGGGDGGTASVDTIRDRIEDHRANRYAEELRSLLRRLNNDLNRLVTLVQIANPDQPRALRHSDMTATQLIADGWCPSCFRDDGYLEPIASPRYRDRCRRCGEHRAATGKDPSPDDLRLMHARGKRPRQRQAG